MDSHSSWFSPANKSDDKHEPIMLFDPEKYSQGLAQSRRAAIGASAAVHLIAAAILVWVASWPAVIAPDSAPPPARYNLVWIASPGPGGGGGGGGNKTPVAARARKVGKDPMTVPAARSEPKPSQVDKEPPQLEALAIPATPLADATETLPGILDPAPPLATTQGPGSGGGAGTGSGGGAGDGQGSGLGPGFGRGTGGGVYQPGSGVSSPQLVRDVKPNYTTEAMRARKQGVVLLECVVLSDGSVGEIKIVKSLDAAFGLDDEAVKAARQWRFLPGRRFGEPVAVLVTLELVFSLR